MYEAAFGNTNKRDYSSRLTVAGKFERRYPEACADHASWNPFQVPLASLFGLASTGVYQAKELPPCWWALTPPFHHCFANCLAACRPLGRNAPRREEAVFFSVALSFSHLKPSLSANLSFEVPTFLPAKLSKLSLSPAITHHTLL